MPAYFAGGYMSKNSVRPATRPQSGPRQAAADLINQAFEKSDIAEICYAVGAATRLLIRPGRYRVSFCRSCLEHHEGIFRPIGQRLAL